MTPACRAGEGLEVEPTSDVIRDVTHTIYWRARDAACA